MKRRDDLLIPLSHAELVRRAVHWLRIRRRCGVVFAELACANQTGIIPDAIGWHTAWSILVECKTSRADFFADRKKLIHLLPDSAPGQERWYFTAPGLIRPDELPPGWWLAEAHPTVVRMIGNPQERFGFCGDGVYNRERQAAELPYLLSALRRHQLGVPFDHLAGRFETVADGNARKKAR